ncbi:hypothetical protein JB92DRAFT_2948855 [Gautieria morchelliformis]|nr:hypothetical protein JB92DRAFT_2948855 [Gautieria morchelliformis]
MQVSPLRHPSTEVVYRASRVIMRHRADESGKYWPLNCLLESDGAWTAMEITMVERCSRVKVSI